MDQQEENRPFWKTGIMWLVIGLPLASVFAGMALVIIATRSGGADVVRDDVRRVSQIQTTDLGQDQQARTLGLSAVLRAEDGVLEVIPVTGDFRRTAPMKLVLQHPSRTQEDVEIELAPSDTGWRAERPLDDSHDWVVQMAPVDGEWRLHGRLPKQQHATRLAPSLAQ
ncbi:MAG TPA: FixH family protein [Luteimonas sp.]|mgnify:CR=1 FL=1|nr:FixH family protein [Luteimonas sp.]HRO28243.1 FixH family protein [Luteimonas sp.]HRP72056.1 FixH family protein [Luteimonas sp.]